MRRGKSLFPALTQYLQMWKVFSSHVLGFAAEAEEGSMGKLSWEKVEYILTTLIKRKETILVRRTDLSSYDRDMLAVEIKQNLLG